MRVRLLLSTIVLLLISCTERDEENNCTKKPSWKSCVTEQEASAKGKLNVRVTINELNPSVIVKLYKGSSVETGTLMITDTLTKESKEYIVSEGEYTGSVDYIVIYMGVPTKLSAIDRDKIRVKKTTYCEGECYEPDFEYLDLMLGKM